MDDETDYPLREVAAAWNKKLELSKKDKKAKFQDDADEAMKFFRGGRELSDLMWKGRGTSGSEGVLDVGEGEEEQIPAPIFRVTLNKAAELVQIFGPFIYHKNPTIVVDPKSPEVPVDVLIGLLPPEQLQMAQMQFEQQQMMAAQQAQAMGQQPPEMQPFDPASLFPPETQRESQAKLTAYLLQYYLDYVQREADKKTHSRRMADEALVKGLGVLWTESYESYPGAPKQIGSFWENVDNLLGDPDAELIDDWTWCARGRDLPYWQWEQRFNLPKGSLKKYARKESSAAHAEQSTSGTYADDQRRDQTNDLLRCYEIFSKCGAGHQSIKDLPPDTEALLESFGQYPYLVVADKVPFFLNLPADQVEDRLTSPDELPPAEEDELFRRSQWPIPFWADGAWPFTPLAFHEEPGCAWPVSHLSPGMGQLKALNWIITFLVNRLRISTKTVVAVMKSAGDEIKKRLFQGKDFDVLEIEGAVEQFGDINKVVHFLDVPEAKIDAWKVVDMLSDSFDKATGLTETAYAMQGGMRTAAEANVKQNAMNIRPDDMANKMEDVMSLVARKEAMAARWLLDGESLLPIMGERCAQLWEQYVMTSQVDAVVREYHYRVEAGSARKPNKETQVANMNTAMQTMLPVLMQSGSLNAANALIQDWCKAMNIEGKAYQLQPPPPPGPDPAVQQEMEMEQQKLQADSQRDDQKHQAKMAEQQQKMELDRQKAELDAKGKLIALKLKAQEGQQKLQLQAAQGQQQMQQSQMKMAADAQSQRSKLEVERIQAAHSLQSQQAETRLKLQSGAAQSAAKIEQMKATATAKPKPKTGEKK